MIVAGIDVGALTTKAVILKGDSIIGGGIVKTEAKPMQASRKAFDAALSKARLKSKKVKYIVSTGWGRKKVEFASEAMGEVSCLGKGARWLVPSIKTVIDIGTQSSNVGEISKLRKNINPDFAIDSRPGADS